MRRTRCTAAMPRPVETDMLYLIYLIAQYRNDARARLVAANDTDVRRAA